MSFNTELKKAKAKLRKALSPAVPPLLGKGKKPPLVMTLLLRNEDDIVQRNIEHHLNQGVDFIVATDNSSTDNTRHILETYEKKGLLHIIDEPSLDYAQSTWVNRMANWAYENIGQCFIFHADADEFWFSRTDNLKNELFRYPLIDCLDVNIKNVLLAFDEFDELFPQHAHYCVENPLTVGIIQEQSKEKSLYLFPYPPKVFYRANDHMPQVKMGNHELEFKNQYSRTCSKDIYVYHFPIRGYEQFKRKVIEGGSAILSNPNLPEGFGWHWRRWYKAYEQGGLQDEYRRHVLNSQEASSLIEENVVDPITLPTSFSDTRESEPSESSIS